MDKEHTETQKDKILVTGGTGFVATHIIYQLLQKNYKVKTTVRSLKRVEKIIKIMEENGIKNTQNLSFVEADLSSDNNWVEIMADCDKVLSVASPVFFDVPNDEEAAIKPAVDGILRILKAAKQAKVSKVVMTSNFGAVGFSKKKGQGITTEADWTNENDKGLSTYEKSKLLAEKAAWEFIKKEGNGMAFCTINPVAIFGPSLSKHISGSLSLINGEMKVLPNIVLNIVDVRDVADLHIRAMEQDNADGERFIASADGHISMKEIHELLEQKRPDIAHQVNARLLPSGAVKVAGLFNKQAHEGAFMLGINREVSNQKSKDILGWVSTRSNEEIVLDSVDSMQKFALLK